MLSPISSIDDATSSSEAACWLAPSDSDSDAFDSSSLAACSCCAISTIGPMTFFIDSAISVRLFWSIPVSYLYCSVSGRTVRLPAAISLANSERRMMGLMISRLMK